MKLFQFIVAYVFIMQDSVFACGFCNPSPSKNLWQFYPMWLALFILWFIFSIKYDVVTGWRLNLWPVVVIFFLFGGMVASIELWTIVTFLWLVSMIDKMGRAKKLSDEIVDDNSDKKKLRQCVHLQKSILIIFVAASLVKWIAIYFFRPYMYQTIDLKWF